MKTFILILSSLCLLTGYSQKEYNPTYVKKLDFSPEMIAKFNSEESMKACEEVYEKLESKGIGMDGLSEEDQEILDLCDETKEDIWDILGGGCSWYCGGGPDSIWATSSLASLGNNNYEAQNIHDGSFKEAWVEGKKGYGIGEKISFRFKDESPRVTQINIVNGYVKSASAYTKNSRVKKFKVYVNDEVLGVFNLKDEISEQGFSIEPLGRMKKGAYWTLTFEILEVYKGTKWDDVVVAEVYFDGLDVHCLDGNTLVQTEKNEIAIKNLKVGDLIYSYNSTTGKRQMDRILEMANHVHCGLIEITFQSGLKIMCTKDHPLLGLGGDWLSYAPEKSNSAYLFSQVKQLCIGSKIRTQKGWDEVEEIREVKGQIQTYTIVRLEKGDAFLANGIWVGTEELRKD